MTRRQEIFTDEYIKCGGNGAAAARKAGYAECTAKSRSSKLLRRDDVRGAIAERLDEIKSRKIAEQQELLEFLTRIIRGQESDVVVVPSGKKFTIPVNCACRLKACEMMLKVYGAFNQKDVDDKPSATELFVSTLTRISEKIPEKFDDEKQSA